jgi:hypothetical protein
LNKRKKAGKHLLLMLLLLGMIASLSTTALAEETAGKESLTLVCRCDGTVLPDVPFYLYRVADVKKDGTFALCGDFVDSHVKVSGLTTDKEWGTAANSLKTYAAAQGLDGQTARTDSGGEVSFPALETGLYLLYGDKLTVGDTVYSFSPFLISLPNQDAEGTWHDDVTAVPKVSSSYKPSPPSHGEKTSATAIKVWNDEDQKDARPESIKVALLKDGSVYDTVELTADNYWRYTWNNLGEDYDWSVIEQDVPADYTVAYTKDGMIFSITNTYTPDIPDNPPPKSDTPNDPTPPPDANIPDNLPPKSDIPAEANIPEEAVPAAAKLPQTGLLQWPIPVMAGLGILLFSLGWWKRFGRRKHER